VDPLIIAVDQRSRRVGQGHVDSLQLILKV